MTEIVTSVNK